MLPERDTKRAAEAADKRARSAAREATLAEADVLRSRLQEVISECSVKQKAVAARLAVPAITLSAFLTKKTRVMRPPAMERLRQLVNEIETASKLVSTTGEKLGIKELFKAAQAAATLTAVPAPEETQGTVLARARERIAAILKENAPPADVLNTLEPGDVMYLLTMSLAYKNGYRGGRGQ